MNPGLNFFSFGGVSRSCDSRSRSGCHLAVWLGTWLGSWLLVLGVGGGLPPCVAWEAESIDTEQLLQSMPRTRWYDKETRSYQSPSVSPERDNPLRSQGWLAKRKPAKANQTSGGNSNWNWNLSGFLSDWFSTLVIVVLGSLLLISLLLLTFYSLRNYLPSRFEKSKSSQAVRIDPMRVSELPFEVRATDEHPLSEAERLMRAGQYDQAIVYLYGYMLLALDHARKIHLQMGKTNRMYLRELREQLVLRRLTEASMLAFEDVYFGKHSISAERFSEVWQQLDAFHQHIAPTAAAEGPHAAAQAATV